MERISPESRMGNEESYLQIFLHGSPAKRIHMSNTVLCLSRPRCPSLGSSEDVLSPVPEIVRLFLAERAI